MNRVFTLYVYTYKTKRLQNSFKKQKNHASPDMIFLLSIDS
jgi:hypothetical protein